MSAGAENPELGVDETAVVLGEAPHFARVAGEDRFQDCPGAVGDGVFGDRRQSSLWGATSGSALLAEAF